jgi:peroxiredoxin
MKRTQETVQWAERERVIAGRLQVPALTLASTQGPLDLRVLCAERAALYLYPATGVPGRDPAIDPAPGWDDIPGAAGCTRQSLGFQQEHATFASAGVRVAGISTQPLVEQLGFAERHALPFPLLCDELLELRRAWALPTFRVGTRAFLQRMVLYVEGNQVRDVLYPVADAAGSALQLLQRLAAREQG